jgi:hypothetical protein
MNPRLPYRPQARPASRPRAFPLIPLLVACLIVVMALQGLRLAFDAGLFGAPKETKQGGVAAAVTRMSSRDDVPFEVQRRPVTVQPHNLQFGSVGMAPAHTLHVFTDPACGPCRQQVAEWLKGVPLDGVRLVYIYWPVDKTNLAGGMVLDIARRESLAQALLSRLEKRRETLTPEGLMAELDAVGVPLSRQQDYLKNEVAALSDVVSQDMAQGAKLRLPEAPVMILDDYLLDGRVLSPARVATYLQRLNRREPILQANDYWLNRGL